MNQHTFKFDSPAEVVPGVQALLGPNAVISHVRKIPKEGMAGVLGARQIEVTAHSPELPAAPVSAPLPIEPPNFSVPKEPGLTWRDFLQGRGVSPQVASLIIRHARLPSHVPRCEREMFSQVQSILITLQQYSQPPATAFLQRTHVFLGPPGSGKTTVLCGFLARAVFSERSVASVSALDFPHPNPAERLALFCDLLGLELNRGHRDRVALHDHQFVDVPGFSKDKDFQSHLGKLHQEFPNAAFHLVLNGAYETDLLLSYCSALAKFPLTDIILTHMDEESRWGKVLNLALGTNFNVSHINTGQNIPGDLIPAAPDLILTRIFT